MRVLGIAGSLRADSHNARLLRAAAAELPPGWELERWEGLRDVPAYDEDLDVDPAPAAVQSLRDAIAQADALIVATPEYNGSVPGALKNAIDWASRPRATSVLLDKPALVVGATTGLFGAVWAQAELRKVLGTIGARVVDLELPVGQAHEALGEDGLPSDPAAREQLQAVLDALVDLARPSLLAA